MRIRKVSVVLVSLLPIHMIQHLLREWVHIAMKLLSLLRQEQLVDLFHPIITLLTPAATWQLIGQLCPLLQMISQKSMVKRSQYVQLHITASKTERMTV